MKDDATKAFDPKFDPAFDQNGWNMHKGEVVLRSVPLKMVWHTHRIPGELEISNWRMRFVSSQVWHFNFFSH